MVLSNMSIEATSQANDALSFVIEVAPHKEAS